MSGENALRFLSEPATLASLAAVAAASMYYVTTRPTPMKCPVDINNQSVAVGPDEPGARRSALCETLIENYHEDVTTLHEAFLRGVSISGEEPCLGSRSDYDEDFQWITYNEVHEKAWSFGSGLMDLGIDYSSKDNYVGIYSQNKIEWVIAEEGCNFFSLAVVPLYDTLGPEACVFIMNQARIKVAICDASKMEALLKNLEKCTTLKYIIKIGESVSDEEQTVAKQNNVEIFTFKQIEDRGREGKKEPVPPKRGDIATICYTSGTTGNPKGAMVTHANMIAMASGLQLYLDKCNIPMTNKEVHLSYLPLAHMYERMCTLAMLMEGGRIGFITGNVKRLLDDLKSLRPTIFISVPRLLNRIYDKVMSDLQKSAFKSWLFNLALSFKERELERNIIRNNGFWDYLVFRKIQQALGGRVKYIISGSAPLSDRVMKFLRCAFGCFVLEGYGQTETTAASTVQYIGDNTIGHVGAPFPCNMLKVVDVPEMDYFAKDGVGEICFKGGNVFQGYLYDEEKTKEAIDEDGWLHSGDIGIWLSNGTIKIVDRRKNIFKLSQGEYIAPEKVEEVYGRCPTIQQCFVTGIGTESCVVALVVPEPTELSKKFQGDLKTLCENEDVKKYILDEMNVYAKKAALRSFEQAKAIHLLSEPFSIENDFLTPTFKMKRPKLNKHFRGEVEELYKTLNY